MTKDIYKAKALEKYRHRRAEAITRLGGKCHCGSTEDLHLIRRPDATEDFDVSSIWSRKPEIRDRLYSQCQVLCFEHAKGEMWGKGDLKHGAWYAAYKKKCDCESCREYRKVYSEKRRADRQATRQAAGLPPRTPKPKTPGKPKAPKAPKPKLTKLTIKPYVARLPPPRVTRPFDPASDLTHLTDRKFPSIQALKESLRSALAKHLGCTPPFNGPDRLYETLENNGWLVFVGTTVSIKLPGKKSITHIVQERRQNRDDTDAFLAAASEVL